MNPCPTLPAREVVAVDKNKSEIDTIEKVETELNQSSEKKPTYEENTKTVETTTIEKNTDNIPIAIIPETTKVAYTNEEKFAKMSQKNPALKTFKQLLSLDYL